MSLPRLTGLLVAGTDACIFRMFPSSVLEGTFSTVQDTAEKADRAGSIMYLR